MILCVNPNAAIDKTVVVRGFRVNEIHRPREVLALPGGKGCNVARALKCLGGQPVVTGWVGGYAGQWIEERLSREGIATAFIQVEEESRTCLSILDPENKTLTELYEKGNPISPDKVAEFVAWFQHEIGRYDAVTFSGSLPPGVPMDLYAQLIHIAREARVPTFLDGEGEALRQGIAAKPMLVKPNKREFEGLLGMKLENDSDVLHEALQVSRHYETVVVISLGENGVLCAHGGRGMRVRPPKVMAVSAVGSGDSLLAGIALGITHSLPFEESLRQGVAAGAANALSMGAGVFTHRECLRMLPAVTLERAE